MSRPRFPAARTAALALVVLLTAGCASTGQQTRGDPWEPMNRGVHAFNDGVDRVALKPAAKVYVKYTPEWLRTGVSNFFTNLFYPVTIGNQVLQGKFVEAGQDISRLVLNTIWGLGGVIDVATMNGLPMHDEDLGQTLGWWGVPPGPYVVLPLLGPATLRDTPTRIADNFLQPFYWYNAGNERWASLVLSTLDKRAQLLPLDSTLEGVFDQYAFIRDAYLQRRQFKVYDGNPPEEPLDDLVDPALEEEAAPGE